MNQSPLHRFIIKMLLPCLLVAGHACPSVTGALDKAKGKKVEIQIRSGTQESKKALRRDFISTYRQQVRTARNQKKIPYKVFFIPLAVAIIGGVLVVNRHALFSKNVKSKPPNSLENGTRDTREEQKVGDTNLKLNATAPPPLEPYTYHSANPFTIPDPYKVRNVNWEASTLNKKDVIESLKDPNNQIQTAQDMKKVWPWYVAFRLLYKEIPTNFELIKLFYEGRDTTKNIGSEAIPYNEEANKKLQNSKTPTQYLSKSHFFHGTKEIGTLQQIIASKQVLVKRSLRNPGAFVSTDYLISSDYGPYFLVFDRALEKETLPLVVDRLEVGFEQPINLSTYLKAIWILKEENKSEKEEIEAWLQESDLSNIEVVYKGKDLPRQSRGLYSVYVPDKRSVSLVPKFWYNPTWKDQGIVGSYAIQRNMKNQLEAIPLDIDGKIQLENGSTHTIFYHLLTDGRIQFRAS